MSDIHEQMTDILKNAGLKKQEVSGGYFICTTAVSGQEIAMIGVMQLPKKLRSKKGRLKKLKKQILKVGNQQFPKAIVVCLLVGKKANGLKVENDKPPKEKFFYKGPFQAHLTKEANTGHVDGTGGVSMKGNVVTFKSTKEIPGRIKMEHGHPVLFSGLSEFYWGRRYLMKLTKLNGEVIWENPECTA